MTKSYKRRVSKGKGFVDDFKKKFKEASAKVYKALSSDTAKTLGSTALNTIILASMGYAIKNRDKLGYGQKKSDPVNEFEDAMKSNDPERIASVIKKSLVEGDKFPTSKTLADLQNEQFAKQIAEYAAKPKQINNPIHRPSYLDDVEAELDYSNIGIPKTRMPIDDFYDPDLGEFYDTYDFSGSPNETLEEMFKTLESDSMTASIANKLTNKVVDGVIREEIGSSGKGLKGRGLKGGNFDDDVKKAKDKIYKIITHPKAKMISASVLATLIITALGGLGYYFASKHPRISSMINPEEEKRARAKEFIDKLKEDWDVEDPPYSEVTKVSHFAAGNGLKPDSKKNTKDVLKIASETIADMIQYARELHLDKAAIFSLITFLLGAAGYGGFSVMKNKKANSKIKLLSHLPSDEVMDAIEEYASDRNKMPDNIKSKFPWNGLGLNKATACNRGGDLSKFGDYAKKKAEAEKNAKPIAKKISDWISSDEAKLIGKAAIQYTILTALGLLTAYAGKKVGELAINKFPEDKTKIKDPKLFDSMIGDPSEADIARFEDRPKYATEDVLTSAFKGLSGDEVLNLKRYALENPKNRAVVKILESNKAPHISDTLLRTDPYLATIFHEKAPLSVSKKYYKPPEFIEKQSDYKQVSRDIQNKIDAQNARYGKSEFKGEAIKDFIAQNLPQVNLGEDIDVAIQALEEVEQNKPNLSLSLASAVVEKKSGIVPPKKISVKDIAKKFSGTSTPTPEGAKSIGDGLKDSANSFGEKSKKKLNEVGDAVYKVITSQQVQGVAGGVTAGLIVSVLSMLMHEKRQEALATRNLSRSNSMRPPERVLGDFGFPGSIEF